MRRRYDFIIIGGGLAGASLATVMAGRGARVLVLEREARFKDRVRGEALLPWGAAELESLGLRMPLLSACGNENRWWDDFLAGERIGHRDTVSETPGGMATLTFYHPEMQEHLLRAALAAGVEVRRGVRVSRLLLERPVQVLVDGGAGAEMVAGDLVVGADGRNSLARRWAGFASRRDPPRLRIAGVLFDGMTALPADTTYMVFNTDLGRSALLIPQGGGRARAYVIFPAGENRRLGGARDIPLFIEEAVRTGVPPECFEGAEVAGPLATFEGADRWVDHPYREGVALIGDAAATSDPAWGQGLSMAVHDARLLRDALLEHADPEAAGHAYAAAHDRAYATIHATEELFTTFFHETGPEADERRARALPLLAEEPDRVPDAFMSGPAAAPVDERTRARFFAEA